MTALRSSDRQPAAALHEAQALQAAHCPPQAKRKDAKLNLKTSWKDESGE
jgi:hypothetical protein